MPLIDKDAARIAAALEDYEHVSLRDIRARSDGFYDVIVTDHRLERDYALGSHCDYWDFIGALVDHKQYIGRVVEGQVA